MKPTNTGIRAPLRIGVGVLGGVVGGPASYGLRLVRALVQGGHGVTVFTDAPDRVPDGAEVVRVPMKGGIDRLRWQYLALGRALRGRSVDVFHDTKNALPLSRRGQPCAVTVHDLAHVHCPETFGHGSRWFLGAATAHAVRGADAVIVPSEATARDVRAHWPRHAAKVHVVLHGIDPAQPADPAECRALRNELGFDGPFVLHVGTVQARKNLPLLCVAVARLRASGSPVRLVAAGRLGWKAGPSEAALDETEGAHWLGAVSAERLRALYAEAALFCSPSAYEGFGFTVADALAAGLPTVVSGISSLPEVVGDAGVVLATLDPEEIARGAWRSACGPPACGSPGRSGAAASAGVHLGAGGVRDGRGLRLDCGSGSGLTRGFPWDGGLDEVIGLGLRWRLRRGHGPSASAGAFRWGLPPGFLAGVLRWGFPLGRVRATIAAP